MESADVDLGAWLSKPLINAGQRGFNTIVLGPDQERALRRVTEAAIQHTAREHRSRNKTRLADSLQIALERPAHDASLNGRETLSEALLKLASKHLAYLDNWIIGCEGRTEAEILEVSISALAEQLSNNVQREIISQGTHGQPLEALAIALNQDAIRRKNQRIENAAKELGNEIRRDRLHFRQTLDGTDESDNVAGHVFISYVHEDLDRVNQLERFLRAAGIQVWRDKANLWPGQDWRMEIRNAIIDDTLAFIVCFSKNSLARDRSYQNEELVLAIEQLRLRPPERPWLIPVRLDDCDIPNRDIGGGRTLASIQCADLFGDHLNAGIARLVAAVLKILWPD